MSNQIAQFIEFTVIGDGVSTTFSYDMTVSPFTSVNFWGSTFQRVPFTGGIPVSVDIFTPADGTTVSISGTVLTLTFPTAPALASQVDVQLELFYNSL